MKWAISQLFVYLRENQFLCTSERMVSQLFHSSALCRATGEPIMAGTMNYPKKTCFNLFQSRHCSYILYSVKTWFLKILSVSQLYRWFHNFLYSPFHKTFPNYSLQMHWISIRFYEIGASSWISLLIKDPKL